MPVFDQMVIAAGIWLCIFAVIIAIEIDSQR